MAKGGNDKKEWWGSDPKENDDTPGYTADTSLASEIAGANGTDFMH